MTSETINLWNRGLGATLPTMGIHLWDSCLYLPTGPWQGMRAVSFPSVVNKPGSVIMQTEQIQIFPVLERLVQIAGDIFGAAIVRNATTTRLTSLIAEDGESSGAVLQRITPLF